MPYDMNNQIIFDRSSPEGSAVQPATSQPAESTIEPIAPVPSISQNSSLSPYVKELLAEYLNLKLRLSFNSNQARLRVPEVLSSLAFIYEKVRNALEYKGEHLLMRNAIERIMRRLIWERGKAEGRLIAINLVRELIWARYLDNDSFPVSKIDSLGAIINKYLNFFHLLGNGQKEFRFSDEKKAWLLEISSCEIEEAISPALTINYKYTEAVRRWFNDHFEWAESQLSDEEKNIQLTIAIDRSLLKSDEPRLNYHLLKILYPEWLTSVPESFSNLMQGLPETIKNIKNAVNNPRQLKLYRFVQKQTPSFLILRDLIERNPEGAEKILENQAETEKQIRQICQTRYAQIAQKVKKGIVKSIVYIFLTKVLLAFLLEFPYEIWVARRLNLIPLGINILTPPFLMFVIGLTVRRPNEINTDRIVEKIKNFAYANSAQSDRVKFFVSIAKRQGLANAVFSLTYLILFLVTFGGIIALLGLLHFNPMSGVVFFVFLSLVLLFGFRVRFASSEIIVTNEREGLIGHLLTNISLPLLNLGVFLSRGLSKLNAALVILDFLVEAPIKGLLEVMGEWSSYIHERRSEVIEIPEN